jgi:glycosyltransferase involved in cell wall biosynthesis
MCRPLQRFPAGGKPQVAGAASTPADQTLGPVVEPRSTELTSRTQVIWLAGPFPPPLSGQATYNVALAPHLRRHGDVRLLGTGQGMAGKLAGHGRILLATLFRMRAGDVVYLSVPGNLGAWLFAGSVAVLRARGLRHFIHHHSFRPLALGPIAAMRTIVGLGGRRQHHILLSPGMRDRFAAMYLHGDQTRAHALSNAWLFCPPTPPPPPRPDRPPTIGHLSVLTRAKGIDTLLRLFRRAVAACPDLRLGIAGPGADPALKGDIAAAVADFPGQVDYRGPVAGAAKAAFYADIDLLVLPTRLVDEAEPLVMLEGWATGAEFMGTDRGCIPERLRHRNRLLTGDDHEDAARILAVLREGAVDWAALRDGCARHAADLHAVAEAEARALLAAMLAPRAGA